MVKIGLRNLGYKVPRGNLVEFDGSINSLLPVSEPTVVCDEFGRTYVRDGKIIVLGCHLERGDSVTNIITPATGRNLAVAKQPNRFLLV